jgi:FtsZ-interacting cell division protein ZipA
METQTNKSSIGGIIGTIIIIAVIILGGLYFWGKRIEESKIKQDLMAQDENVYESNEAAVIKSLNTSDDLNSIESDLNNSNLDDLGQELNI